MPPEQEVAGAITYIGEVLLEFSLRFTGSLTVVCPPGTRDGDGVAGANQPALHVAGTTLHRIADGLYISAVRADRPLIESTGGHRFVHRTTTAGGPRTRRFTGDCLIDIAGGTGVEEPAITGTLGYVLDVRALAPSDPPGGDGEWRDRHHLSFASLGAIVLEPVPVAVERAARLYAAG